MVKLGTTKLVTMKYTVQVTKEDIDNGACRLASRCMEVVANFRILNKLLKGDVSHVRIDAGAIRFTHGGYKWNAATPKVAKVALIRFDNPNTTHLVKPHSYKVTAIRGPKVRKLTPEDQARVTKLAAEKRAQGYRQPYHRQTLRQRIVGYA